MESIEYEPQAEFHRKPAKKIIKVLLLFIFVLIVLVFLLLPFIVSSKAGNNFISVKINNSVDGRVDFAGLSMSWFKGIIIDGLSFKDNADKISVHVKQITTRPRYGSILKGDLSFGKTTVDRPEININLENKSTIDASKAGYLSLVMDVVINDGNLKLTDSKSKTVELSQINSNVSLRPPGMQTEFDINLAVGNKGSGESQIRAKGKIKPGLAIKEWSVKGTTGDLNIEVTDLDLESLGSLLELADIDVQARGKVSADFDAVMEDGNFDNLTGSIKATNIDVVGAALKGDNLKTGLLTVDVKLNSQKQLIKIEQFKLGSDWLEAEAIGTVPTTFSSWSDFLTSDSDVSLNADFELDTVAFLSNMPNTFKIKEGMKITSGKLSGIITASRGKLNSQVNLNELTGTFEGKALSLSEPITGNLQISGKNKKISFDELDVSASFAKINANGLVEQLKYDGRVDLEKLQSEFGQFVDFGKYEIAGEILGQGTLYVRKDKITGTGTSEVKNLRIASKDDVTAQEKDTNIQFSFALDRKTSLLTFESVGAKSSLGQIDINQAVLPIGEKTQVPFSMNIIAKDIDLGKVKPFAVLFARLPKETQLAGTAESNISLISYKNIYKVATDSTKIHNLKLTYSDQKPFEPNEVSLAFQTEINPEEKAINVKELQFDSPQIKIRKGEFSKFNETNKTKLTGKAELEYDWSAVSTVAAPFLPEGLTLKGERKDSINFTSEYPINDVNQLLPNLTANARLGFNQASYMGLEFGSASIDMQIRNGFMKIEPFKTSLNGGKFNFAGQVDFGQKPAQLKMSEPVQLMENIEINNQTRGLLLYLNPIFADTTNISGIANFHCERLVIPLSSADKSQLEISGTVSIDQVRLEAAGLLKMIVAVRGSSDIGGSRINLRATKFVLKNGFLKYDDMQIEVGDNPVNFKGVIGLNRSLNMTVTLPYTSDGQTVRIGHEISTPRIEVKLKGTIDKPELDVGSLLESQLRQQLEIQLQKGLEQLFK
ncbi:MAG: hypothetical protein JW837_10335 [Sedimentisphaerales bacterium]|nr:hypothetical protein [Sedimentisphaerales bacterium]